MSDDFTPTVFTADYVGEPGNRVFYLQARGNEGIVTFLLEKQQVSVLAEKLREMLVIVDRADLIANSMPERDPALALTQPVEPEWRVGAMGLAYEEDPDRILIFLQPVEADDEDSGAGEAIEGFRFTLRRDQVRTFVLHAEAIVAEGRPLCQLCGLPIDPEGHICPASNGHRPTF